MRSNALHWKKSYHFQFKVNELNALDLASSFLIAEHYIFSVLVPSGAVSRSKVVEDIVGHSTDKGGLHHPM
jgi:hypothetical protein